MRKLQDYKSYKENILDEWNATALFLQEVLREETAAARPRAFVQSVMSFTIMAGANAPRRANLLKAGELVLSSLHLETPPSVPKAPVVSRSMWRTVKHTALLIAVIGLCLGAFAAGFAMNMPLVISHLPRLSTTPPKPSSTPEEVIRQFVEASHRRDIPAIVALYHPEVRKRLNGYEVDDEIAEVLYEYGAEAVRPLETHIESVQEETTAKAIITLRIPNTNRTETGTIHLRKFENVWYLINSQI